MFEKVGARERSYLSVHNSVTFRAILRHDSRLRGSQYWSQHAAVECGVLSFNEELPTKMNCPIIWSGILVNLCHNNIAVAQL